MATSSQEPVHSKQRDRRETARTVAGLTVVIVTIVFALVNLDSVKVDWIVSTSTAPLIIVIAVSVVGGFMLGWLGHRSSQRRRR